MTTKIDTTAMRDLLTVKIAARKERDSKLASNAVKRSDKYCAFFATDRFATFAVSDNIDVESLFGRCDKTLDRFVRVTDSLLRGDLSLTSESDQNRYTFNLARTLIASVAAKVAITKRDILATGSRVDEANDFVTVSRRVMQDSTAERQTGIAQYVLESLGFITRSRTENNTIAITVNTKSAVYKRFVKLLASA